MQILTIPKGFEAFKCKLEPFERDSKNSNANFNHSNGIQSIQMKIQTIREIRIIWMQIRTIRKGSNHSKGIWSIQMQIRTIQKGFGAFESKFESIKRNSKHSKIFEAF